MSDGFDKEAEREKLREKFADDEEKREHTQRMSELLLQGATMTNRHCDDCGDPIFRKDGQEFCPTCHTVDAADVEDAESTAAGQSPATSAGGGSPPTAGGESPPATGGNGTPGPRQTDQGSVGAGPESAAETPDPSVTDASDPSTGPSEQPVAGSGPTGSDTTGSTPSAGASGDHAAASASAGSESVADARASLARTLNRFAAAAEETDDPRRARDHLQAAREAAEALAALDR